MGFLKLGWRSLWRDWRAGELRLLIGAVALAVAALTSVGFFADRLQAGLQRDAAQLLGGDLVLASDHTPPDAWLAHAHADGLTGVLTLNFPTMARTVDGDDDVDDFDAIEDVGASRMVALKAVPEAYPLRGRLRIAQDVTDRMGEPAAGVPATGEAWVDRAVLAALGVQLGDGLMLGEQRLKIAAVLVSEPDRGTGLVNFAPRVMINLADLPATQLVQPASRVGYRLALVGDDDAVARFSDWVNQELANPKVRGVRLETLDTGRPEMQQTLGRAQKFLNLVVLLAAMLSAVAVALAARGFAARHLDAAAMLRVLGVSQRRMAAAYVFEFLLVGVIASALGVLLGWALHHVFVRLMAGLLEVALPTASAWPALAGLALGLVLLATFGLPPVLQLARVPPLRVMRRDVGAIRPASLAVLTLGVVGFAALLLVLSADLRLGLIAVSGFAAAALLFGALAWAVVKTVPRLVPEARAPRWLLLATRQLASRPMYAVVQVSSLALGLLALVLLVLLRTDLIDGWHAATPVDAPNRFVINITPDQADDFRSFLKREGVDRFDWYPMFRGRLVTVNGHAVDAEQYADGDAQRLVEREFNLSYAADLPAHNNLAEGGWNGGDAHAISVEQDLAEKLNLKLGDTLAFDVGGLPVKARVRSLRKVDWSSMRVNFFVIFPVANMPEVPVTWIAGYRAPADAQFDHRLMRQFANVTNIDTEQTIAQLQQVLDQISRAVEFLFGFTLAAGLLVLLAALGATREERAKAFAIMRAVGASSRLLRAVQRTELVGVGLLAGLLAGCMAMVMGWALARWVFEFAWTPPWWVPLVSATVGGVLALLAGWWGLREVLRRPVVQTLRQAVD